MTFAHQVGLLLWKNYVLHKRHRIVTATEIIVPTFFSCILFLLRVTTELREHPASYIYEPEQLKIDYSSTIILFSPNHILVQGLMQDLKFRSMKIVKAAEKNDIDIDYIQDEFGEDFKVEIQGFNTQGDLERYYLKMNVTGWTIFAVQFENIEAKHTQLPDTVHITLRPARDKKVNWKTGQAFEAVEQNVPRLQQPDYRSGNFLFFQNILHQLVIEKWNPAAGDVLKDFQLSHTMMPYPSYMDDPLLMIIQKWTSFLLLMSLLVVVIHVTKGLVNEKEMKIKETMKMMGLQVASHWAAWIITFICTYMVVALIWTMFCGVKINDNGSVLKMTNPIIFFLFLLIYGITTIAFCTTVSVFIQKSELAGISSGVAFLLTFIPWFQIQDTCSYFTRTEKILMSLDFNLAMALGMNYFGMLEGIGLGAQWNSYGMNIFSMDDFNVFDSMMMMMLDTFIFVVITWYVDQMNPGDFGVALPWYFPFTSSFWFPLSVGEEQTDPADMKMYENNKHFQELPRNKKAGIKIVNLTKKYGKGKHAMIAVKNLYMNVYEGEIMALLGHNGAGKTTTIAMLTGFISPTSGTAFVNGFNISRDMQKIREGLGLCPQQSVVFNSLTVWENLLFFAALKGVPRDKQKAAAEEMIHQVGLHFKRDYVAKTLSGGHKRKLSVAIALIGGSKIIILDEPTSGMDPASRRQLWDILQQNKAGRTMILSTHYMDEADILGDRITIMAAGVAHCSGTSMFLKKLYGTGYHMAIVKEPGCDVNQVTEFIKDIIPEAILERNLNYEIHYLLPFNQSHKFYKLFSSIENEKRNLLIMNVGASATTMEEVFINVGKELDEFRYSNCDPDSHNAGLLPKGVSCSNLPRGRRGSRRRSSALRGANTLNSNIYGNSEEQPSDSKAPPQDLGSVESLDHSDRSNNRAGSTQSIDINDNNSDSSDSLASRLLALESSAVRSGKGLKAGRFMGLFIKKVIHSRRNMIIGSFQTAIPVLLTVIILVVKTVQQALLVEPRMKLDMSFFVDTTVPYAESLKYDKVISSLGDNYASLFDSTTHVEKINRSTYPYVPDYFWNKIDEIGITNFNRKVIIGAGFQKNGNISYFGMDPDEEYTSNYAIKKKSNVSFHGILIYNRQAIHSLPISMAYLMNAIASLFTGGKKKAVMYNFPLPILPSATGKDETKTTMEDSFAVAVVTGFGLSCLTSSFVYFLIKEREVGAKHLQKVSGVDPVIFWSSNFLWDYINYLIPCLILIATFVLFREEGYVEDGNINFVSLLFIMYGWAAIPLMYLLHFLFTTPASGMAVLLIMNILTSFFTTLFSMVLASLGKRVRNEAGRLNMLFTVLFPQFSFNKGLLDIRTSFIYKRFCTNLNYTTMCEEVSSHACCEDTCDICMPFVENYFQWESPGIGKNLFTLFVQGIIYFVLTVMVDYHVPQRLAYWMFKDNEVTLHPTKKNVMQAVQVKEDSDVRDERLRINNNHVKVLQKTDSLILKNVYKRYGPFVSVDNICLGVAEHECFGLLGENGAGKSTTFKILTGEIMLTSGNAYVKGYDIRQHLQQVHQHMGYCPQVDALIGEMTGRETLYMYARLKGIPENNIEEMTDYLIEMFDLEPHADKQTSKYSGGNIRRLSTAVSLVGDPPFILLDEPSTGMDPIAKEHMWKILSRVRAAGRTLFLTSHSMEECEALCTRIGILVNGSFRCLGTTQHLKSKYGQGYTIIMQMKTLHSGEMASAAPVVSYVKQELKSATVFGDNNGYIHLQVPDPAESLAHIFNVMESVKSQFRLKDYSVHQTSLEQVFLYFTRHQVPPRQVETKFSILSCYY